MKKKKSDAESKRETSYLTVNEEKIRCWKQKRRLLPSSSSLTVLASRSASSWSFFSSSFDLLADSLLSELIPLPIFWCEMQVNWFAPIFQTQSTAVVWTEDLGAVLASAENSLVPVLSVLLWLRGSFLSPDQKGKPCNSNESWRGNSLCFQIKWSQLACLQNHAYLP